MNPNVFSGKTKVAFTDLIDLANENVGGEVISANDEFFAEKKNLIKSSTPVFIDDKYSDFGKWMDGWETRRKRTAGYDHCIVKLGIPGQIIGVNIDTAFFTGNHQEYASIEGCEMSANPNWIELLPKSSLNGGTNNYFSTSSLKRITHIRLNIFPDGGVARLRVHGIPKPDSTKLKGTIDLAAAENGAKVITCNDSFFGPKDNLILPGRAKNMGGGWETRRKRGPGNDWIIIKLCGTGKVTKIEVDTNHYKGNFPDMCSIDIIDLKENHSLACDFRDAKLNWTEILPKTKLSANNQQIFAQELKSLVGNYIRLNIYPDGGISRFRVFGELLDQ